MSRALHSTLIYACRFGFVLVLAAVVSGCGGSPQVAQPTAAPTAPPAPTLPPPSPTPSLAIKRLDDVPNAVLYIEVEGGIMPLGETKAQSSAGSGSGFIIDPSGIAVTNNHVVTGAGTIKVHVGGIKKDPDGEDARVLGISECSDLAVIQILGNKQFPYLQWYDGDIKNLLQVVAFGFPYGTPSIDSTMGSISQVDANGQSDWASLSKVLEHTARINPGNSGGPLVAAESAQVVGINYAGDSKTNQYYAIGRDEVRSLIDKLKSGKDDTSIGVNGEAFTQSDLSGIWVRSVKPGSPASQAGLKPGDIITSMYNTPVGEDGTMTKYCDVLHSHPNEAINLSVIRPSTQEKLEGELNSPNAGLKVVGSYAQAPTSTNSGSAAYTYHTITSQSGALSMDVPTQWSDVTTDGVWKQSDKQVGIEIGATPDNKAFQDWTGPGAYLSASRTLVQNTTPDQLLDGYKFDDTCKNGGRDNYNSNLYTGRYDHWTNCKGNQTELYVVAFVPQDKSFIGMLQIQVVSDADQEALKRIIQSFQVKGGF